MAVLLILERSITMLQIILGVLIGIGLYFISPTVVIAAITSQINKKRLPTHILISTKFLPRDSIVLLEQIRTIDKSRLINRIATLDNEIMEKINTALQISVEL